jgi:hypothetical protein
MQIYLKGEKIFDIGLFAWPDNCGYAVLSHTILCYKTPRHLKDDLNFIKDIINYKIPSYQCVFYSIHESSSALRKIELSKHPEMSMIHSGVSKYGDGNRVNLHMWNPSLQEKLSLEDIEMKYNISGISFKAIEEAFEKGIRGMEAVV